MNTLSVLAAIAVTLSLCLADDSIVKTDTGDVQGLVYQTHRAFLGIPFIEPPVGSLRWAPPVVAKSWAPSKLDATKFKPGCPQHCHLPPGACPPSLSEDCMYLNVYTPRKPVSNKLPIIVWFPGGHFEQGSAGSILYDGAYLVTNQSQVILVAINYRLGALGWLTNNKIPELADGNFGLQDQIEGLKWVQRNAAAFGGDPNQVTVAGQSAGATSSAALLVSPAAKGLFAKIILQSNPISLPFRYRDDASTLGQEVGKILKCDNIDCYRSKSADEIVDAQHEAADKILLLEPLVSFLPWAPTVDEKLVPMRFLDAIQKGQYNKDVQGNPLPMIMGTVAQEAVIFVYMVSKKPFNDAEYIGAVALAFGTSAFRVLSHYPPTPFIGDKRPAISVLVTDYLFGCVNRYAAGILQTQGNKNLFLYRFNHSLSFDAWGPMYPFCEGKVCHGAELPILFHQSGNATLNANENRLFNDMASYWTNFAWTSNPNTKPSFGGRNVPTWPAFTPSVPQHMELWTERSFAVKDFNKVNCDMFDSVGYWHGAGGK